jgi:hypothetical protein
VRLTSASSASSFFGLMVERLDAYRAGRLSLGRLVSDREGIAAQLEVTPDAEVGPLTVELR